MPISDEDWAAQIHQESRGRQSAVSPDGAVGVAQVMRDTGPEAAALAGLPWDERLWRTDAAYNSRIGRAYMDKQLEDFGGDIDLARAAYNAGPSRVRRALQSKGADWLSVMPAETRDYVTKLGGSAMPGDDSFASIIKEAKQGPSGGIDNTAKVMQMWEKFAPATNTAPPSVETAPTSGQATIPTQRTDMGKPRTTAQKAGRLALTAGGGVAGGIAGAALGGLGAVAGAGLGSAAGSYASELFDPSADPHKEAFIEGAFGMAGQGVGGLFGKLIPTSIRPGAKELLKLAGKDLPVPGQVFDSKAMNVLHNIGMSSFIGADSLERATQASLRAAQQAGVTWQQQLQANLNLAGQALDQVSMAANRVNAQANISQIRAAAKVIPDTVPADSAVRNVSRILTETKGNTLPFSRTMEETMANAMAQARGLPITPKGTVGLKEIRTQLMDVLRDSTNTAEKQAARNLVKLVDEAAESALSNADPRLATQWRDASALYREGIQGKEIGEMFSKALPSGAEPGSISGKLLQNALKEHRLAGLPTELSPAQLEQLGNLAKALQAAEGSGSKAFSLLSNGLQANAVVRISMAAGAGMGAASATGNDPTSGAVLGAATMLLGPAAIAKALASKNVMRLMLALSRMPASSKAAGTLGTQLVSQMFREGILTADEQPQTTAQGQPPTSGTPQP